MKFGRIPVKEAEGTVLAHGVRAALIRKGRRLTSDDLDLLEKSGVSHVFAARLEPEDIGEDEAASQIAASLRGGGWKAREPSTGRVNLHAEPSGVFTVNARLIARLNAVDPAITIATLRNFASVSNRQMVATVKIIPFAVRKASMTEALAICESAEAMAVHGFQPKRVALIQTRLEGTKTGVLDKTARMTADRLSRSKSVLIKELRIEHGIDELAAATGQVKEHADIIIIFGASATSDRYDVIPAAIEGAGGEVIRVGMPVDPGNLITLGEIGGKPVLGAPGCARSPKENGFDWVLDRMIAGLKVTGNDIAAMGVGGLLTEIGTRPTPREPAPSAKTKKVWTVLLAAGRSSRMGGPNKLLAEFDGVPLVRRSTERLLEAEPDGVIVVTGYQREAVEAALDGVDIRCVYNPDFASGLSSSLKCGLSHVPEDASGAMIALADMPAITAKDYRQLMVEFRNSISVAVIRATHAGKRGNPVILPRNLFELVENISGDTGARQIVESGTAPVIDVEIGEGASLDVDTCEALFRAGGSIRHP